jgi:plasmid rolling circle replication initiator protein Rep
MMWKAKFIQILPDLLEQHPAGRWLFLTLTIRNCDVKDLRKTIQTMNHAWTKLVKRKEFKDVLGWIRTTEITRNDKDNTAHPHFHVLLLVKSTYFGRGYINQEQWTSAWQNSLKIDYTPIVNVKAVKDRRKKKALTGESESEFSAVMAAALETLKYAVKPSDMLADKDWFLEMAKQTFKLRFIASGGLLKDVLKDIDYETDSEKTTEEPQPADIVFEWQNGEYAVDLTAEN